ncbi:type II toxin-antitoxin system HicA family toxin [Methanogenium marinum]|uniref:type II toxin-antitoxin system HicA family toxin n=1 Tax=Methanogenium marinum TaxID=348610 RepID=UPI003B84AD82
MAGSHHIYAIPGDTAWITVPVHGNTMLKIGLQKHLMKITDIDESELYAWYKAASLQTEQFRQDKTLCFMNEN